MKKRRHSNHAIEKMTPPATTEREKEVNASELRKTILSVQLALHMRVIATFGNSTRMFTKITRSETADMTIS